MKRKEEKTPKPKRERKRKIRVLRVGPRKLLNIALWVLLLVSISFGVYKNFTAIDTHTVHEVEIIETEIVDTSRLESFVAGFADVYFSWENTDEAIEERAEHLEGYLTSDLLTLGRDMVTKDTPTVSRVQAVQIWQVAQVDENRFELLFSVDRHITEIVMDIEYEYVEEPQMVEVVGEDGETEMIESMVEKQIEIPVETTQESLLTAYYTVTVYEADGDMVIIQNPTISGAPQKAEYEPEAPINDGSVDLDTRDEIEEFLSGFFALYPGASARDLSYYVRDAALEPVGRAGVEFMEILNPVYSGSGKAVTASFAVAYYDTVAKVTEISQYSLSLEKSDGIWVIVGAA